MSIAAYGSAIYFLGLKLKFVPFGIAYAIWSGLGIIFIAIIGRVLFGQMLDLAAVIGISLIIIGIVVINLFSRSGHH